MIVIGSSIVAFHEALELAVDEAHSVPELWVIAYPLLHPLSLQSNIHTYRSLLINVQHPSLNWPCIYTHTVIISYLNSGHSTRAFKKVFSKKQRAWNLCKPPLYTNLRLEVVHDLLDLLLSVGGEQYLVEVLILVPNLTVWKRKTSRQFALKNGILFYIVVLGRIFL